jgi:hypothetical protein
MEMIDGEELQAESGVVMEKGGEKVGVLLSETK